MRLEPIKDPLGVHLFIEGITSIDYLNCFYYINTYLLGSEVWRSFLPVIRTISCKVNSIIVIRNNLQWICFTCYFFSSLRSCPWKIFFTFSFTCSFIFFFPASTLTVPVVIICIPIIIKSTAINLLINNFTPNYP